MAQAVRIQCVSRQDRDSVRERLRSIGGRNPDGTHWELSEEQAIASIREGRYSFYVEIRNGYRVPIVVARSALGSEYLKTVVDGIRPDELLSLPECR